MVRSRPLGGIFFPRQFVVPYALTQFQLAARVPRVKGSLVQRVDFPVSGENVCVADKRGAGPAGLSKIFRFLTEGLLPQYDFA